MSKKRLNSYKRKLEDKTYEFRERKVNSPSIVVCTLQTLLLQLEIQFNNKQSSSHSLPFGSKTLILSPSILLTRTLVFLQPMLLYYTSVFISLSTRTIPLHLKLG